MSRPRGYDAYARRGGYAGRTTGAPIPISPAVRPWRRCRSPGVPKCAEGAPEQPCRAPLAPGRRWWARAAACARTPSRRASPTPDLLAPSSRTRPRAGRPRGRGWRESAAGPRACPRGALQLAYARQVDDVHALGRHVGEAVTRGVHDLWGGPQLRLHVGAVNCSMSCRPSGVVSCPRATCLPSRRMVRVRSRRRSCS